MFKQLIKAKQIEPLPAGVKAVASSHKLLHASLLAGLFEVPQLHDEVKSQIQDLSDAIASQLQTQQESRYKRWEIV